MTKSTLAAMASAAVYPAVADMTTHLTQRSDITAMSLFPRESSLKCPTKPMHTTSRNGVAGMCPYGLSRVVASACWHRSQDATYFRTWARMFNV